MDPTWRSSEAAPRWPMKTCTSARLSRTGMEVNFPLLKLDKHNKRYYVEELRLYSTHWWEARWYRDTVIKLKIKTQTGNGLRYCNCHGSACNKDWSSAEEGEHTTPSPPDDTIKYTVVFVFLTYFISSIACNKALKLDLLPPKSEMFLESFDQMS